MDVFTASPEVRYRMTFAPIRTKSADACVENNVQDEVRPGAGRENALGQERYFAIKHMDSGFAKYKDLHFEFFGLYLPISKERKSKWYV